MSLSTSIVYAQQTLPDTIPGGIQPDTLSIVSLSDSLMTETADSLKRVYKDSIRAASDLKSRVKYNARDSIVFDLEGRYLYLYGDVTIDYEDINLTAELVEIDWTTTTLFAKGVQDSTGQFIGQPAFNEGGQIYNAEEIAFNFKTRKGRILGGRTQQDENYVIGDTIKRNPDNSYFIRSGKITTCSAEHPHFYIYSNRMKVIPNDKVITGRVNMFVEDVPVPLVLPFGFFPNKKGKKSGILMPSYGNDATRGFFLSNGGYYYGINEYVDLSVRGDIYALGSWRLNTASRYNKRYRFDGGLDLQYAVNNSGDRTNIDYRVSRDYFVKWRHNQKLGTTAQLSGDVNYATSSFLSLNSMNAGDIVTNTLVSKISYNKSFANSPWNMTAALGQDQNTRTQLMNFELPTLALNRARTFPFKRKTGGGSEKWYEKIGYSYSGQFVNRLSITESSLKRVNASDPLLRTNPLDSFRNGIQHTIPVQMNFKTLKHITISPGVNYTEYWYFKEQRNQWVNRDIDPSTGRNRDTLQTDTFSNLLTGRQFSASVNASTRIYGMLPFNSKRQRVIRHTFTPNISYTYKPDFSTPFWGYYYKVQTDSSQTNPENYALQSRFNNTVFGGPTQGEQQSIGFGMINLFEMKYKAMKKGQDTLVSKPEVKKLTLIDNIGLNGAYNLAADSFQLSVINFTARTVLLRDLLNINFTGVMDPYTQNEVGRRVNTYRWSTDRKPGHMTNANMAFGTSLRSKKEKPKPKPRNIDPDVLAEIERNKDMYADFNIPWSLNLNYNILYSKPNIHQPATLTQAVNITGDMNLTEKWKIRVTSGYDLVQKEMTLTQVNIIRDLHCWEASLNWIPFGTRRYFMLTINAKSSTLQDLKLTKQSPPNYSNLLR